VINGTAVSYLSVRFRSLNSIRKKRAFASRQVGKTKYNVCAAANYDDKEQLG
jgi:hypothetical protein